VEFLQTDFNSGTRGIRKLRAGGGKIASSPGNRGYSEKISILEKRKGNLIVETSKVSNREVLEVSVKRVHSKIRKGLGPGPKGLGLACGGEKSRLKSYQILTCVKIFQE